MARKALLKTLGSLSLGVREQRPIFKPSQQCSKCVLCYPLNESCSSLQPSLSFALKRARGNGIYLQEDGSKHQLWLLQPPSWWLPAWWHSADGILAEIFSRFRSTGKKSRQWEHSLFCIHIFSPPAFDQTLVKCWHGPLCIGVSF